MTDPQPPVVATPEQIRAAVAASPDAQALMRALLVKRAKAGQGVRRTPANRAERRAAAKQAQQRKTAKRLEQRKKSGD